MNKTLIAVGLLNLILALLVVSEHSLSDGTGLGLKEVGASEVILLTKSDFEKIQSESKSSGQASCIAVQIQDDQAGTDSAKSGPLLIAALKDMGYNEGTGTGSYQHKVDTGTFVIQTKTSADYLSLMGVIENLPIKVSTCLTE